MNDYDPNYKPEKVWFLVGVKAVVTYKDKVLLLKRSDKVKRPGEWDLCGGGLDKGEAPEDGAKREIMEESGLEVTKIKSIDAIYADHNGLDVVIIAYFAVAKDDKVTLSWEHEGYKWIAPNEALEEELLPHQYKRFIEKSTI